MVSDNKKRVCMIYTGGTIGMIPSDQGYIPNPDSFLAILNSFQDMYHPVMPEWELIEFTPLLDSSNITVKEWNKIGQVIRDKYDDFDGFVILHDNILHVLQILYLLIILK